MRQRLHGALKEAMKRRVWWMCKYDALFFPVCDALNVMLSLICNRGLNGVDRFKSSCISIAMCSAIGVRKLVVRADARDTGILIDNLGILEGMGQSAHIEAP